MRWGRVKDHLLDADRSSKDLRNRNVLASAAGLVVMTEDIDVTGVDLGFRAKGRFGRVHHPMIEAQVRTWSKPEQRDGLLQYRGLNEWQFDQLAGPDFSVPRYLFVICVPPNAGLSS